MRKSEGWFVLGVIIGVIGIIVSMINPGHGAFLLTMLCLFLAMGGFLVSGVYYAQEENREN